MDIKASTIETFGQFVRDVRKRHTDLGQVDAARLIGVSPPVMNKLEQGKEVWLSKALDICNGLGIEIILRFPDEEEAR